MKYLIILSIALAGCSTTYEQKVNNCLSLAKEKGVELDLDVEAMMSLPEYNYAETFGFSAGYFKGCMEIQK